MSHLTGMGSHQPNSLRVGLSDGIHRQGVEDYRGLTSRRLQCSAREREAGPRVRPARTQQDRIHTSERVTIAPTPADLKPPFDDSGSGITRDSGNINAKPAATLAPVATTSLPAPARKAPVATSHAARHLAASRHHKHVPPGLLVRVSGRAGQWPATKQG